MLDARIVNVHILTLTHWYTVVTQSITAQLLITETPWHNNSYYVPCPAQQHNSPITKEIFVSFPEDRFPVVCGPESLITPDPISVGLPLQTCWQFLVILIRYSMHAHASYSIIISILILII